MANRKGTLAGSGQTDEQKPEIQRRGPDHNHWAGTREWAGCRVTGLERCTGPKANQFQKIKGLAMSLFSPHLCKSFSVQ